MAFLYLEIGVLAFAPGLTREEPQTMLPQDTADRFPADRLQAGTLPQEVFQLCQRPRGELEAQVLRAGGGGIDDHTLEFRLIDARATLSRTSVKAGKAGRLEALHPFVGIGIVQPDNLAGLGDTEACRQLPDKIAPAIEGGRSGLGPQQTLQLQQFFAGECGKKEWVIHGSYDTSHHPGKSTQI